MGVPKFYRWQSERYPCLSEVVKENQIPEFDNLYLDMNGIIHTCTHPNDDDVHFRMTEEDMFKSIFHYIEVLFRIIKPRKVFFMAVDGVAPRAKMNQQRGRRFRSAQEAEEREKEAVRKGETLPDEKRFDSNCITPGTDFMVRLQRQLKYFVNKKITSDTKWQGIRIFLSGHETPGEGEHKIMDFIRAEKARKDYDSNTRHCLYGLDADLIMLGLISHEPHFSLLREEVRFGKQAKRPTTVEETTFHLLHLSLFREYLALEFGAIKDQIDWFDTECIIDDWVMLGFLVGNDFVPHLPDLHISHSALPLLYKTYIQVLPTLDGYINEGGHLNLARFGLFMKELSKYDYENFDSQAIDLSFLEGKQDENAWKSKKVEMKKAIREKLQQEIPGFMNMEWIENKTIDELSSDEEDGEIDPIEMEFKMKKKDYYDDKMGFRNITKQQRAQIVSDYIHAIQWILHYYYNGIQSWSWYYPHHYAPYMSDLKDFADLTLTFDKGQPFLPFEQLLAVLPPASRDHLPEAYWPLMLNENSPIIEYYPLKFEQDLNGKLQSWEAVVLIPFIDEKRLWAGMKMHEHKLKDEERKRNCHSEHLLYTTDLDNPHTYISSLQGKFPDIINCIAKCELIRKDAFQIEISKLKKGLLSGVRLGVYFPGFPTLYHLDFEHEIRNADVKVFQQLSRGENCILSVNAKDPKPDAKKLANELLGETVFAEWPHLKEVKVVAVSDGQYRYELIEDSKEGSMQEMKLKPQEADKWKRDAKTIGEEYFRRKGVNIRETKVILYACPLLGRRYVCGVGGNVTVEKQWTLSPIPYAYQVTIKDIAVHDPSFHQFKTLSELYPIDAPCFMLGNPHYGCQGKVETASQDRVQVLFSVPNEPNLDYIKATQHSHKVQYLEGYVIAQRLGISSMQASRLTGSVYVTRGPRPSRSDEGFRGSGVNVGLNLKFNKTEQEVPGYTQRNDQGKWTYSIQLMEILDAYLSEFPAVIRFLSGKGFNDTLYEEEMFAGADYGLEEVKSWIDQQASSKASKSKIGSQGLEAPIIKLIEEEIEKVKESGSKKKVKLSVRPHLLYRPMDGQGNLIADPDATYLLFDRVINIREGFTVPLGLRGVVTGIHTGATVLDTSYDVVFDEEFPGALELRCTGKRGYRLNPTALINISYGHRKFKGQQKYEKTMAVVKPQVKKVNPNASSHSQSQEYYQNRMAKLGSGVTARSTQDTDNRSVKNRGQDAIQTQVYSSTKVREGSGGSPISYAAATNNTSQAKVAPVMQVASVQHAMAGMQGLGKIPGGKADTRGGNQRKGARDSPVKEKKVTILKRNQGPSDVQDVKQDERDQTSKRDDKKRSQTHKVDKTEDGLPKGSPSARLPRLNKGGAPTEPTRDDVDELSSIWQKLMLAQDSPARSEDESRKVITDEEEGQEDSEEYVTSLGSGDDESDEEQEEMERMTPNTYRKSQTEQLCHLLNISKTNPSTESEEPVTVNPGQESSRPGYAKQLSVAELFESAKNTGGPPHSPISLPQGGPVMHSKPMGQVAPHLQVRSLLGPPLMENQSFQQQLPKQPFMIPSPSKSGQVGQVGTAIPSSFAPTNPTPVSPQKPFMTQQMRQAPPVNYQQQPPFQGPQYGSWGVGTNPPMMSQRQPFMPPPGPGYYQGPPAVSQVPPGVPQGAAGVYQGPAGVSQGPAGVSQGPAGVPQGPPGVYQGPPGVYQGPPGISQGPPGISQGPAGHYQGPPPQLTIPPAIEMLKGWCLSKKVPPPNFTFQTLPQGMTKAICILGSGISFEGPPCPSKPMAVERAAGVALHKLRIVPVHQWTMPGQPGMMPPPPHTHYKQTSMHQGYQQGMPPSMMSHPQQAPPPGIFVPLQVTRQLSKPSGSGGIQPGPEIPASIQSKPGTVHSHHTPVDYQLEPEADAVSTFTSQSHGLVSMQQGYLTQTDIDGVNRGSGSQQLANPTQSDIDGTSKTEQSPASKSSTHSRGSKKSRAKLAISFSAGK